MYFSTATIIAVLPALGLATTYRGVGTTLNAQLSLSSSKFQSYGDDKHKNAGIASGENECGVSSFTEITEAEGQAPTVADCRAMLDLIRGDEEWTVTTEPQSIVSYGSCSFNAVVRQGQGVDEYGYGLYAEIGNADIIDLVTDSINKFEREGSVWCEGGFPLYVSTSGTMPCDKLEDDDAKQVVVDWTLTGSGNVAQTFYA